MQFERRMALALDLLRELLSKFFFLHLLPVLLRGGAGVNFLPVRSLGVGRRWCILRLPMSSAADCKCLCCNEKFHHDARNRRHQQYCAKDACRKASKVARQARWLAKPENLDHWKGPENVQRVQEWRKANPGYSRRRGPRRRVALQDISKPQPIGPQPKAEPVAEVAFVGCGRPSWLDRPFRACALYPMIPRALP